MTGTDIVPVILCGGSGTRLWPMSRKLLPKQFLPLASERTLFQDTVLRLSGLAGTAPPVIVSNDEHRFLAAEQLRELGAAAGSLLLEPAGRNTAPAVAAAALEAVGKNPGAILFVLPSDHVVRDLPRFLDAAARAVALARQGLLATFGIVPDAPETGYGYIERGEPIAEVKGAHRVARFVEKPDAARAAQFLASGRFFWNSGMFALDARQYLEELERFRPDILAAVRTAWERARRDLDFIRLDAEAFGVCASDSIDYAVMERTRNAAVIEAAMGWSDVGSWSALWSVTHRDEAGNEVRGDVDLRHTRNSLVRAEHRLVSVIGVENLVVVETSDAVLVASRDHAQAVKDVVARLDSSARTEHLSHRRVYRPWGYYEGVDEGSRYQVKRLMVKPGQALSLQLHHRRAEHWVVVSGRARVTCGDTVQDLVANQSTYIPVEAKHRLENPGSEPLYVVEVQSGDYLGEDDIERFEDRYARQ
ncbi:MAG: mannose-1-phosphate guanylyltransferase/mannose-6-phosphate isomerase [Burkholderiales bacterium]|nr:mannose-1-phosphate guanylyltransferase/mannose-6-phosphate isomerase [Burkholderiales bacterium]